MNHILIFGLIFCWGAILTGSWLGWQLLRQNGRLLLRVDELENRLNELEFGGGSEPKVLPIGSVAPESDLPNPAGERQTLPLADGNPGARPLPRPTGEGGQEPSEEARANHFSNHSLARSNVKRDGLKAGTPAPDFRLPRLDGRGDLVLSELCGRRVLLVFSSPHCGPCNALAPELERFHREHPELEVVMISKGEPAENRTKVKDHGLTFPVVLQQQWEVSRRYAMFATPIAYAIDATGVIAHDVAVGIDAVLDLLARVEHMPIEARNGAFA
jgi:peroxiredoxin